MTVLRKFGILTATGVLGFLGYRSFFNSQDEVLLSESNKTEMHKAITNSRHLLLDLQKNSSIPGLTVAVSVNGSIIWREGFGYKDLENKSLCSPKTVMKIASISKCITSIVMAKEIEHGRLNLDENISNYVSEWPAKYWENQKVDITPRLLACHMGGIRGYQPIKNDDVLPAFRYAEYSISEKFKNIKDALKLFQNDPLVAKPGEKFVYSNHGYTLLSAALESTSKKSFRELLEDTFRKFGMRTSFVDDPHKIIYDISRQYSVQDGKIVNAPYVESSFKIAAAGMLSSSVDLVRFANVLLQSYFIGEEEPNSKEGSSVESYLKKETLDMLWTPVNGTSVSWHDNGRYGLGWQIVESKDKNRVYTGHTGRSVGASSVLLISIPLSGGEESNGFELLKRGLLPFSSRTNKQESVVVAILSNLEGISLGPVAMQIADNFEFASKGDLSK